MFVEDVRGCSLFLLVAGFPGGCRFAGRCPAFCCCFFLRQRLLFWFKDRGSVQIMKKLRIVTDSSVAVFAFLCLPPTFFLEGCAFYRAGEPSGGDPNCGGIGIGDSLGGCWMTHTVLGHPSSGQDSARTYFSYNRTSPSYTGIMVFLHGDGDNPQPPIDLGWGVAAAAELYGFLAVIPRGSSISGSGYKWCIATPCSPSDANDVEFVKAVVADAATVYSISAQSPRIVLGFSKGAELAALLACHQPWGSCHSACA